MAHLRQVRAVAPDRRQLRRRRLDDRSELEQVTDELFTGLRSERPAEHVWIEEVPAPSLANSRSDLWAALNQALCRKHAHCFAIGTARHLQLLAELDLTGKDVAGLIVTRQDRHAELMRD